MIIIKTKIPKCVICKKPMRVIYTQRSFKIDGKYKTYFQKEGYLCSHIHQPIAILTAYKQYTKNQQNVYMIGIYDYLTSKLLKALKCFKIF